MQLESHITGDHELGVFENWLLRKALVYKIQVTGGWRKLHNEGFQVLYSSPNIIMVTKSNWTRYTEYVACIGKNRD